MPLNLADIETIINIEASVDTLGVFENYKQCDNYMQKNLLKNYKKNELTTYDESYISHRDEYGITIYTCSKVNKVNNK